MRGIPVQLYNCGSCLVLLGQWSDFSISRDLPGYETETIKSVLCELCGHQILLSFNGNVLNEEM